MCQVGKGKCRLILRGGNRERAAQLVHHSGLCLGAFCPVHECLRHCELENQLESMANI